MKTKKIYKERHVYFFKCSNCEQENRQSYKRAKAKRGICRKCKSGAIVNKDQISLL